jgi:hypothetical protein
MKLWLISQGDNCEYDSYDSAVVAAETRRDAQHTHPRGDIDPSIKDPWAYYEYTWVKSPDQVDVNYLGVAEIDTKAGVICASFNAG